MSTTTATAAEEAARRHPSNHTVDDPFGETGYAQSDPYGYEDTARRAFIEGAEWQAEQIEAKGGTIVKRAAIIAADSGAPVEEVTAALTQTTDVWRRYTAMAAIIEQAKRVTPGYAVDGPVRKVLDTAPTAEALDPIRQAESYRFIAIIEEAATILRTPGDHPINRALAVLAKAV